MNYELAKELEQAGFPQGGQQEKWLCAHDHKLPHDWDGPTCPSKEAMYVPTLEELIEACGAVTIKLWINGNHKKSGVQLEMQSLDDVIWYDTPTEAVARLWLALNKHEKDSSK